MDEQTLKYRQKCSNGLIILGHIHTNINIDLAHQHFGGIKNIYEIKEAYISLMEMQVANGRGVSGGE